MSSTKVAVDSIAVCATPTPEQIARNLPQLQDRSGIQHLCKRKQRKKQSPGEESDTSVPSGPRWEVPLPTENETWSGSHEVSSVLTDGPHTLSKTSRLKPS